MTVSSSSNSTELDNFIAEYATALKEFEQATSHAFPEQALNILLARDKLAVILNSDNQSSASNIAKVLELDEKFKKQGEAIANIAKLEDWRASLNPPESSWWWFVQPRQKLELSDIINGTLRGISIVSLTAFIACMTSLIPRFAVGGFGILESFGIIGQGGLLTFAFSSLQGGDGQKNLSKFLNKLGIPPHLEAEFSCGFSVMLLLGAIATQANLPNIANFYYQNGLKYYNQGSFRKAEQDYQQALSLNPDHSGIHLALGEVYEAMGELSEAEKLYKESSQHGVPQAFVNLGRIYADKGDLLGGEALFRVGLQVAKEDKTKFELHANLGWTLLQQKKVDLAIVQLETALKMAQGIPEQEKGGAMTNCILAKVMEIRGNQEIAKREWETCQKFARPARLNEYKWLLKVGENEAASNADTSSVVNGEGKKTSPNK